MFMEEYYSKNQHVYPTRGIHLYSRILIIWWKTVIFCIKQNNEKQQNDTSLKTSTSLEQQGNCYPKKLIFF